MEIEWLILADFAQIINNKLYLQGGGWDRLTINSGFPATKQSIGVAASVRVPWGDTNQEGNLKLKILTQDGEQLAHLDGKFKVGRPADHPEGEDQRIQIAGSFTPKLERPGVYIVTAEVNGAEGARVHFNVVPGPILQAQAAQQGGQ